MSACSAASNTNVGRGPLCAAIDGTDRLRLRDQAPVYQRLDARLYWSCRCVQRIITWDLRQIPIIKLIEAACLDDGDAVLSLCQTCSNSQSSNTPSDDLTTCYI